MEIPPVKVAARNIGGGRDGAQEKRAGPGKAEDNMGTNKKAREGLDQPGLLPQAQHPVHTSRGLKAAQVLIPIEGV